jgi:hypothetical protein
MILNELALAFEKPHAEHIDLGHETEIEVGELNQSLFRRWKNARVKMNLVQNGRRKRGPLPKSEILDFSGDPQL